MERKLSSFQDALDSFRYLVEVDMQGLKSILDDRLVDGLENGKVQKFEICTELCWKAIKKFLLLNEGVDAKTPKQSIKEFFLAGHVSEAIYGLLLDAIADRHNISHVYDNDVFEKILIKFPNYITAFQEVLNRIKTACRDTH